MKNIVYVFFVFFYFKSLGQTLSYEGLREEIRIKQLAGIFNRGSSLTVNPVTTFLYDSTYKKQIYILPVSSTLEFYSHHPAGYNDGSLIPAKGFQTRLSAGLSANMGKMSIQMQPEFVYAENPPFQTFFHEHADITWSEYYHWLNTIDMPERMGSKPYLKIFPGQTSIRYNTKNLSFGISTENLWWGPGLYNALIMTNNAPGYLHVTMNTTQPIATKIGAFEGQVVGGRLEDSGIDPPEVAHVYNGQFLYEPKHQEWRYMTGMVLTWQPKWIDHLFLGISKASYLYHSDISNPLDVLPLQGFFGSTRTRAEKTGKKASMGSFFVRYFFPSDKAELYMEYGRGDKSIMPWNIFQKTMYRRAYVAGFSKLFDLKQDNTHILLNAELTQLEVPTGELINDPLSWYTHNYVRQGYTNHGQVIGAGMGPGSNSQTLELSWVRGYKKIGIRLDRLVHNNDFYLFAFEHIPDFRRYWIDLSTVLMARWDYHHLLFSANFGITRSLNYEWFVYDQSLTAQGYFTSGYDVLNFSGKLSLSYRF